MDTRALYLEADEDITSAIDKLRKAPAGPVQIVVPKRSTLLQSVVNLKLLKKAADDSGRELVLVTGDKVATSLAARVGLAVAPSVGAKALLADAPAAPVAAAMAEEVIEDDTPAPPPPAEIKNPDTPTDSIPTDPAEDKPVQSQRALAKAAAIEKATGRRPKPQVTQREIPDEPEVPDVKPESSGIPLAAADGSKGKSPKVPNYNSFQKRMLWLGAAAAVVVAYFVGVYFLSSAKVTLYVSANTLNIASTFAVDTAAASSSPSTGVLAGQTVTASKTVTGTFQPTGSQNIGTKASGTLTVKNCDQSNAVGLPAGTTFTSAGNSFVSTSAVTISGASFTNGGKTCLPGGGQVPVTATAAGDQYNLEGATFTSPSLDSNYTITGTTSGGTTNVVQIVQQSDVTSAQTAALSSDKSSEQSDLSKQVGSGYQVLPGSFAQNVTSTTSSPAVGAQGTSATITLQVTYSETVVKTSDLSAYAQYEANQQAGSGNQVYDNGASGAQIATAGKTSSGLQQYSFTTTAYSGPTINTTAIAKQMAGQRYGAAQDIASQITGVVHSTISLTPPWSSSLPHLAKNISVKVSVQGVGSGQ